MFRIMGVGVVVAMLWPSSSAWAQRVAPTRELTFEGALQLARKQAPRLRLAATRVDETRSKIAAAGVWPYNPKLGASAGPRFTSGDTTVDWSIGIAQELELGGARGKRIALAQTQVRESLAKRDQAEWRVLRAVALAFVDALYWQARSQLATKRVAIGDRLFASIKRRSEVGQAGAREGSLASLYRLRMHALAATLTARATKARGRLKVLLGGKVDQRYRLLGSLRELCLAGASKGQGRGPRPEIRALTAQKEQLSQRVALARAKRIPLLTLGTQYSREENAHLVKGVIGLSLPFFDSGQGDQALAQARRRGIELALKTTRRLLSVEEQIAHEDRKQLLSALKGFETLGLPQLKQSEAQVEASYSAGAIALSELLAFRQETLLTRRAYLDLLFEGSKARVELMAARGDWH